MPIFDETGQQIAKTVTPNKSPEYYRENKYVKARLKGATPTSAAFVAGADRSNASRLAKRLESRDSVQMRIKEALQREGVTTRRLARTIKRGLSAVKVVTSPTEPDREVVDYGERRQYTKLALEAMGELESKTQIAVQVVLPQVATQPEAWGDALIIAQPEEQ